MKTSICAVMIAAAGATGKGSSLQFALLLHDAYATVGDVRYVQYAARDVCDD